MRNILFVCTGNTCRSCMAQYLFDDKIKNKKKFSEYKSVSAGISAFSGDDASKFTVEVLKNEFNIHITNHKARKISQYLVDDAYLVLTMTNYHKSILHQIFKEHNNKIFTLNEYSNNANTDVLDPYGQDYEVYKKCAFDINNSLTNLLGCL